MEKIIIGIDCGINGAIAVVEGDSLSVTSMPIKKQKVGKKNKSVLDLDALLSLLKKYTTFDVIYCVEKQGVRPGEGAVSAMTIGKNYGILLGMGLGLGFKLLIAAPQQWKSSFPQLTSTPEINSLKDKLKSLRIAKKKSKGAADKKSNRKEAEIINRTIKTIAKSAARTLAAKLYPELGSLFERKKDDGRAEATLIAKWAKENHELVQTSTIASRNLRGSKSSKSEDEILPSTS